MWRSGDIILQLISVLYLVENNVEMQNQKCPKYEVETRNLYLKLEKYMSELQYLPSPFSTLQYNRCI